MKSTIMNLNEQASETLGFMLEPDYLEAHIEKIQGIEDFILDQWRDFQSIPPEGALTFLDTLRSLRRDFQTLHSSFGEDIKLIKAKTT